MIALRLRANGHCQEEVEETIRPCAPAIRERRAGRNWQRYAERTAAYAFGYAGDRDMERNARNRELWRRVEGREALGQMSFGISSAQISVNSFRAVSLQVKRAACP